MDPIPSLNCEVPIRGGAGIDNPLPRIIHFLSEYLNEHVS